MDMSGVNDMDAVALSALERDMETLLERGISFACAGMKGPVRDLVERAGWPQRYGRIMSFLSVQEAVAELGQHPWQ